MNTQIFQLNVPVHLTRANNPAIMVTCKTQRFLKDGKHFRTQFIDVDTDLMISVINWFAVLKLAIERAEEIWNGNAKPLGDIRIHANGRSTVIPSNC